MSVGVFVHHPFGVNVLAFAVPGGGGGGVDVMV